MPQMIRIEWLQCAMRHDRCATYPLGTGQSTESRSARKGLIYSACKRSCAVPIRDRTGATRLELVSARHRRAAVKRQEMPTPQAFPDPRVFAHSAFCVARLAEWA